ncbi:MAG TPA: bifunctional diguanylate cyclase/phosphodiesterase [Candidatus Limnocylindrales bacterium]|nr:bifunctional diguanylate cyclase/phosphodiesterase [Candidatus Limnocylindrales bacterium]
MHSWPQHHTDLRDPILDGRNTLRLVKLRLGLTLLAVAILPIAAVSPLVRAVAEEARITHHERLADQAQSAVTSFQREVARIQDAERLLLDDPAIKAAAAADAATADKSLAYSRLAEFVAGDRDEPSNGELLAATLLNGSGVVSDFGTPLDVKALPPQLVVTGLAAIKSPSGGSGADGYRLLVVESTEVGVKPARTIITSVSIPSLLAASVPGAAMPGRVLRLSDGTGTVLAENSGAFDPSALPGEVLDIATMAAHDSDGRATVQLPGIDTWQIVVSAPIPLVAMPIQALGALAAMLLLLIVFTVWMARQILRPAAEMESQRAALRELYETAREAALRDSLTGLGNHRAFQEAVARMVEGARRYGTAFSLVLIDIDEFKRINDTRGHAVGDQLLSEVGALISTTIRNTDAAFRVGGDEFALLLPHTDVGGAIVLARRLLQRGLEDRTHGEYRAPISFSAGVTSCPEFGTTRMELTAQADAALYRGKRAGRTVVTIYDPEKDHGHVDEGMRAELSSAISAVIEAGTLTPVYQPIVELETGRVTGYEGLVRVPKQSTFAHAGALFDAAEVAGRVADLDRAALEVVLRGARDMSDDVTLSVNVSPQTLESPQFSATAFLAIIRRHGFAPGRVVLELTEREAIRDPERLRVALRGVQMAGVRVAADDVGAGNAGLRLLSQFQFDVVKIDLSLVQRAGDDRTHSVLRSIVEMAQRMNARTIAEGVETSSQLRTARRLGITAGQGYLLGRPGTDRDLPWVDIAALEQRDEVPIPVVRDVPPAEPVKWDPLAEPDDALRPDAPRGPFFQHPAAAGIGGRRATDGAGATGKRGFSFLRAGRKPAE